MLLDTCEAYIDKEVNLTLDMFHGELFSRTRQSANLKIFTVINIFYNVYKKLTVVIMNTFLR